MEDPKHLTEAPLDPSVAESILTQLAGLSGWNESANQQHEEEPQTKNSAEQRGSTPPIIRQLEAVRVLLVDDEPDNLELLTLLFKRAGANVATASSARDALNVLRRADIEVLVSDIQMPGEDGYELIHKVRALITEQRKQLTAVALTAHAGSEDRMRALQAGYQAHIPKPVEPEELIQLIADLVREDTIQSRVLQNREP